MLLKLAPEASLQGQGKTVHSLGGPGGSQRLLTTQEIFPRSVSSTFKVKVKVKSLSRVRLFVTPWTVAYQAPLSMGFSRQEYWSGLPFPSPGDLPDPGIKPRLPALEADALTSEPPGKPLSHQGHSPNAKSWMEQSR